MVRAFPPVVCSLVSARSVLCTYQGAHGTIWPGAGSPLLHALTFQVLLHCTGSRGAAAAAAGAAGEAAGAEGAPSHCSLHDVSQHQRFYELLSQYSLPEVLSW